jgi:hypothetical protein
MNTIRLSQMKLKSHHFENYPISGNQKPLRAFFTHIWGYFVQCDYTLLRMTDHYGKVRLKRWNGLRDKRAPGLTCDLVRAETHLEKEKPPQAVWFAWLSPLQPPPEIAITAQTIWLAYVNRWPIEPGVRFRKETLDWTLPRFQSAETGDTWTWLVALAHWMLFLAPPVVQDRPLPWHDPAAGAPESGCDFLADWNASPASQTARKIARLAQRQAQNAQRAAPSGQKGRFCHPNRLKFN